MGGGGSVNTRTAGVVFAVVSSSRGCLTCRYGELPQKAIELGLLSATKLNWGGAQKTGKADTRPRFLPDPTVFRLDPTVAGVQAVVDAIAGGTHYFFDSVSPDLIDLIGAVFAHLKTVPLEPHNLIVYSTGVCALKWARLWDVPRVAEMLGGLIRETEQDLMLAPTLLPTFDLGRARRRQQALQDVSRILQDFQANQRTEVAA
jgi:hypothetical protein